MPNVAVSTGLTIDTDSTLLLANIVIRIGMPHMTTLAGTGNNASATFTNIIIKISVPHVTSLTGTGHNNN